MAACALAWLARCLVACRSRRAVQLRLWLTPDRPARVAPGKMGGHKLSATSGEHRLWVLQRTTSGDSTLRGLAAELAERGLKVGFARCGSLSTPRSPQLCSRPPDKPQGSPQSARGATHQQRAHHEPALRDDGCVCKLPLQAMCSSPLVAPMEAALSITGTGARVARCGRCPRRANEGTESNRRCRSSNRSRKRSRRQRS